MGLRPGFQVVKIDRGDKCQKAGKNQPDLIKFMTSYCSHVNQMNVQISHSSVITCQNNVKLCIAIEQDKTS